MRIRLLALALFSGLSLAAIGPGHAHATAILEGTTLKSGTQTAYHVQIIEGDEIKTPAHNTARLYGGVAVEAPPLPEPAEATTTRPSGEIENLIARHNRALQPEEATRYAKAIRVVSNYYRLDPKLLASLVAVESSFRSNAISRTGAIGLGQLKPATAQWLGVDNPYDPYQNLMGVGKYMRFLLDRYNGSITHALAAYYQGQGTIDRRGIDGDAVYYIGKVHRVLASL